MIDELQKLNAAIRTEQATARDPIAALQPMTHAIRVACADIDVTRRVPAEVIDSLRLAGVFQ